MNFLVFQGWRLKLCDFGLSVPIEDCQTPTSATNSNGDNNHNNPPTSSPTASAAGSVAAAAAELQPRGTYAWMAPESMALRSYSFASDVYALSLLIYELTRRQVGKEGMGDERCLRIVYQHATYSSLKLKMMNLLKKKWKFEHAFLLVCFDESFDLSILVHSRGTIFALFTACRLFYCDLQVPFEGWTNDAIQAAVVGEGARPSLGEDDAQASGPYHVPSAVMDVVEAGWSHDPSTRPHAAEMEEELR